LITIRQNRISRHSLLALYFSNSQCFHVRSLEGTANEWKLLKKSRSFILVTRRDELPTIITVIQKNDLSERMNSTRCESKGLVPGCSQPPVYNHYIIINGSSGLVFPRPSLHTNAKR
jgi:hypothetical protein